MILGKIVDSLGMTTSEEKLEAIRKLEFPKTLETLEQMLGFTGSLRHRSLNRKVKGDRPTEYIAQCNNAHFFHCNNCEVI